MAQQNDSSVQIIDSIGQMSDIEDRAEGDMLETPGGANFNPSQELPFVHAKNGDLGFVKSSASSHSHKNSSSSRQARVNGYQAPQFEQVRYDEPMNLVTSQNREKETRLLAVIQEFRTII